MPRQQKYSVSEGSASYQKDRKGEACTTLDIPSGGLSVSSTGLSSIASSKTPIVVGVAPPKLVDDGKCHWTWIPLILVGMCALTFLACIWTISGSPALLVGVGPWTGNQPFQRQGRLVVYPIVEGLLNRSFFPDQYFISLDAMDHESNFRTIKDLTDSYPHHAPDSPPPSPYVHCYLELPSPGHPCFYDRGWFGRTCNATDRYGYHEDHQDHIDPCFVIRIENSGPWQPRNIKREELRPEFHRDFESSFISLNCRAKAFNERDQLTFDRYPIKGFPIAFFPASDFNGTGHYLTPAVMVKVKGLRRGHDTTIECWIRSPNSYHLKDSGSILVSFLWSSNPEAKGQEARNGVRPVAPVLPDLSEVTTESEVTEDYVHQEEPEISH